MLFFRALTLQAAPVPDWLSIQPDHPVYSLTQEGAWRVFSAHSPQSDPFRVDPSPLLSSPQWNPAQTFKSQIGYSSQVYWFQYRLRFSGALHTLPRWLSIGSPRLEYVDVYVFDEKTHLKIAHLKGGQAAPRHPSRLEALDSVFALPVEQQQNMIVLVRIQSRTSIEYQAQLVQPEAYRQEEGYYYLQSSGLFGMIIVAAMIAFIIFIQIRDKTFLCYFSMAFTYVLYEMSYRGMIFLWVWPHEWIRYPVATASFFSILAQFFLAVFLWVFLKGATQSKAWRFINYALLVIDLGGIGLHFLVEMPLSAVINNFIVMVQQFVYLPLTVMAWLNHQKEARFLILSLCFTWITTFLRILKLFGVPYVASMQNNSLLYANIFGIVLLIVALVDRLVLIKNKGEESYIQALELSEYTKQSLEEAVAHRTQELKLAQIQAESASRAKSTFLARMSHELRTPLSLIVGMTRLMIQQPLAEKKAHLRDLNAVQSSATHLLSLIDEVLEYARLENKRLILNQKPLVLTPFLNQLSEFGEHLAKEKGLLFGFSVEGRLPLLIEADEIRLRQIVLNLFNNAVSYTVKGSIFFSVESQFLEEETLLYLKLSIRDTGQGVLEAQLSQLCSPFERGEQSSQFNPHGLGLGLAISKELIHLMGGELTATAQPTGGSCFAFSVCCPILADTDLAHVPADTPSFEAEDETLAGFEEEFDAPCPLTAADIPPAAFLEDLQHWLEMGEVSEIEHWSLWLLDTHPEWKTFAQAVYDAAIRLELNEIKGWITPRV